MIRMNWSLQNDVNTKDTSLIRLMKYHEKLIQDQETG